MREYLVVFLVAGAVTYLLTVVAREIALRTGAVAAVRDRDVHAEPIPYMGGLAMLGGLVAAYLVARQLPFLSTQSGEFIFPDVRAVLMAGALVCAVGVLDDIFELDALTKFGGQVLAVGLLVYSGIQFRFFYQPDGVQFALDSSQGALLTAFIVIAEKRKGSIAPTKSPVRTIGSSRLIESSTFTSGWSRSARVRNAEKSAREVRIAEPMAKPLPIAAVVLPAESRTSVRLRICSPMPTISARRALCCISPSR